MDERRKQAYRYLIYWAMLEIRGLEWVDRGLPRLLITPAIRRDLQRASRAGALADWLHNASLYSAYDFEGFSEDRFWGDYDSLVRRHGEGTGYREVFERCLAESEPGEG